MTARKGNMCSQHCLSGIAFGAVPGKVVFDFP